MFMDNNQTQKAKIHTPVDYRGNQKQMYSSRFLIQYGKRVHLAFQGIVST